MPTPISRRYFTVPACSGTLDSSSVLVKSIWAIEGVVWACSFCELKTALTISYPSCSDSASLEVATWVMGAQVFTSEPSPDTSPGLSVSHVMYECLARTFAICSSVKESTRIGVSDAISMVVESRLAGLPPLA